MKKFLLKFIAFIIFFFGAFLYKKLFIKDIHAQPPIYQINLDLQPEERWKSIISTIPASSLLSFAKAINPILDSIKPQMQPFIKQLSESPILPEEYQKEIQGIVQALHEKLGSVPTELQYENILLMNIAYSLFLSCTSGIIVGEDSLPYLFRNFDLRATFLRKALINIEWYKDNTCLFKTTGFPFFVSAYTGEKNGKFAISINGRHSTTQTAVENLQNYLNNPADIWESGILLRHTLQYAQDYDEAYALWKHTKLIASTYLALTGIIPEEGVIFVREQETVRLKDKITKWQRYYPQSDGHTNPENQRSPLILDPQEARTRYIVITNIDPDYPDFQNNHWACKTGTCNPLLTEKKANSYGPRYRRNSALNDCCALPAIFTIEDLFKRVLWRNPVKNDQTIYSTVMCPAKNLLISYTN